MLGFPRFFLGKRRRRLVDHVARRKVLLMRIRTLHQRHLRQSQRVLAWIVALHQVEVRELASQVDSLERDDRPDNVRELFVRDDLDTHPTQAIVKRLNAQSTLDVR